MLKRTIANSNGQNTVVMTINWQTNEDKRQHRQRLPTEPEKDNGTGSRYGAKILASFGELIFGA